MAGIEDIVGKTGNYNVRDKFKRFDQKFIRPLVLKHIQVKKTLKFIYTALDNELNSNYFNLNVYFITFRSRPNRKFSKHIQSLQ